MSICLCLTCAKYNLAIRVSTSIHYTTPTLCRWLWQNSLCAVTRVLPAIME